MMRLPLFVVAMAAAALAAPSLIAEPLTAICAEQSHDIIFVVDGSSSVGSNNFLQIIEFIKRTMKPMIIGQQANRIGFVQIGTEPVVEFYLDAHDSWESLDSALSAINHRMGLTFSGKALHVVRDEMLLKEKGARDNTPTVIIYISDGMSLDDPIPFCDDLKDKSLKIIAIGVGLELLDEDELLKARQQLHDIASTEMDILELHSYEFTWEISQDVLTSICEFSKTVDCVVEYGEWSVCSATCGEGTQLREGRVTLLPANGGIPCEALLKTQPCTMTPCLEETLTTVIIQDPVPTELQTLEPKIELLPQELELETTTPTAEFVSGETLATEMPKEIIIVPVNEAIMCGRLSDGNYPSGECNNEYITCLGGDPILQKCQLGLIYDPDTNQCDAPQNTRTCTGTLATQPPTVIITEAPTLPPVDFDCKSNPEGLYANPDEPCDHYYYVCTGGITSKFVCPADLYFDEELQACDTWIRVPSCSGRTRTTPKVEEAKTTEVSPVDCHEKKDGSYADPDASPAGCSQRYVVCLAGVGYVMRCSPELYFHEEKVLCAHIYEVEACGQPQTEEEQKVWETSEAPTLAPVDFQCTEQKDSAAGSYGTAKMDGLYADSKKECSQLFYSCTGGLAREWKCPEGLIFDPDISACDLPSNTRVCTGTPRTEAPTTAAPVTWETTTGPVDCGTLSDGLVPDPEDKCSRVFYTCSNGMATKFTCPGNLYYNQELGRCDLWLDVMECSGATRTSTAATLPTEQAPTEAPEFDCRRLDDGDYPNPDEDCSEFFYICANGATFKQVCPTGLYYDPQRLLCDNYAYVTACGGEVPEAKSTTVAPSTEKPGFDCRGKTDGHLEGLSNCSQQYYMCSAGYTFKMDCSGKLYFDTEQKMCNWFNEIIGCVGETRPTAEPKTVSTTERITLPPVNYDCSVLGDGDHPEMEDGKPKCDRVFYTCTGGKASKRECPAGTYFDDELLYCDVYANIPLCNGKPRAEATIPTTPKPTEAYPFDCTRQYDGFYAAGECEEHYWSCVGGLTFKHQCTPGLLYDAEEGRCNFRYYLPACGGERPTTLSPEEMVTAASTTMWPFECRKKPDGNFPDPDETCAKHFYVCNGGQTFRISCPPHLYYDQETDKCDFKIHIKSCAVLTT